MNAHTAKEYSKQDWQKLASDAETKIEGRLFINGEYCEAADGGKFEVINPSTNEVFVKRVSVAKDPIVEAKTGRKICHK